ncbi:MAG: SDR family oxidoreductase [Mizugakiibacter sp.]|uniref:SDR family NAD(P)-dependent oxidoreductase n=1 Tax=Mizugakiibacter sp. TaxID=1972610 RepID=UPI0031C13CCA|nr:SDR family oxidoreductase [Xanthomonadaceae bacterium]
MNASTRPTALVTGASGGIGMHLAECFARDGHDLVLVARSADALARLAADWGARYGVRIAAVAADLSREDGVDAVVAALRERGLAVDALVNNAGVGMYGAFSDTRLDDELAMMRLNMLALTALTKRLLPGLIARRGRILNVASTAAFQPGPYMAVYYATKAYVLSFSEALADELAADGVTVTALCPGPTHSGFQARAAIGRIGLLRVLPLFDAATVAAQGYRAMRRGRRVYVPGLANRLLAQSVRVTPRRLITAIVRRLNAPR